jgi:predicted MFS family arabinose efflux permease
VIAIGQGATALMFGAIALLAAAHLLRVAHLAAGTFVMGLCFAFMGPARQAFVVDIVPAEHRGNAMALSQVANSTSRVVGPALAGILLAWGTARAAGAYAVMGALYLLSAASLLLLPRSRGRDGVSTPVLADVFDGLRYVRSQPRLFVQLLVFVGVIMLGFPYVAVMPGLVENQLGREAEAISLLMGITAAGGLISSVLVARFADSPRAATIDFWLGVGFAGSLFALAAAPSYGSAALVSFALGVANGGFQTLASAVLIHGTRPEYVGRVMSLTMLAFAGFGLVALPIGALADAVGERLTLAAMGAAVAACVAAGAWALRPPPPAGARPESR